jgi:hypothetical protein
VQWRRAGLAELSVASSPVARITPPRPCVGRSAVAVTVDLKAERDLGLIEVVKDDVRSREAAQL